MADHGGPSRGRSRRESREGTQGAWGEFRLPPGAAGLLAAYAGLVRSYARRLDLVSPADLPRLEERHIADSLRILPLVDGAAPGPVADVGSGAGLPGIPLAIARPGRVVHLIEPRRRRAAFLEEAVRELGLGCEVHVGTAGEIASRLGGVFSLAAARALAPPAAAFSMLLPLLAPAGVAAVFLGAGGKVPRGAERFAPGIATMRPTSSPAAEG